MSSLADVLLRIQPSEAKKLAVWAKADLAPTLDPAYARRDAYNRLIVYSDYGNRDSEYGWEFDHYPIPKSRGGTDDISNLRPLNWRANVALGGLLD